MTQCAMAKELSLITLRGSMKDTGLKTNEMALDMKDSVMATCMKENT